MRTYFALVDANNFYASCERLFNPSLENMPVVVLSNNDGCAISRSNEAKALGIGMGEPAFKIEKLFGGNNVKMLSSNFALYGDISSRMFDVIGSIVPDVIQYSIDEAFIELSSMADNYNLHELCCTIVSEVYKQVGIPVSIGIGCTKTLAKVANHIAKKTQIPDRVFDLSFANDDINELLKTVKASDIWGIGRAWSSKLKSQGISSAYDLKIADKSYMRAKYNIVLYKTIQELNGLSCINIDEPEIRKQIIVSRTLGEKQTEIEPLRAALANHVATAASKLRKYNLVTSTINVHLRFSPKNKNQSFSKSEIISVTLALPTQDTKTLLNSATKALKETYKVGRDYRKVGVSFTSLHPTSNLQMDMFSSEGFEENNLMASIDNINKRYGRHTLKFASQITSFSWQSSQKRLSGISTTKLTALPIAYCK